MAESRKHNRRVLKGIVISDAMEKTIVVEVDSLKAHPVYKKRYHTSKKYFAHDEDNQCNAGDTVTIAETRPFSKKKRWRLLEIVKRAR